MDRDKSISTGAVSKGGHPCVQWFFDRYGEPDVMRSRDVPVPEPQEDEVLIRVGYAGVNPADSKARAGHSARAGFDYLSAHRC